MQLGLPRHMRVLHNRNFRLYFTGQAISLTGMWMQALAQGWVVLTLTDSIAALGVVNFAFALPSLLFTLMGGVAADRWDRRRLMISTQAALMLLALLMSGLLATDTITFWLLLVMTVLMGIASAYDMPVQQAIVPNLVSPPEIPQAIAMNQVITNGSRLVGPALAGIAIAQFGLASAYLFNGISYVAVIASLLLIRLPAGHARGGAHDSMLRSLREGLAYVRRSRLLRGLFGVSALSVLCPFPTMAVLQPGYVREVLDGGPGMVAVLMAASGGASLLGAVGMLWVPARRRGAVMAASVAAMALSMCLLALGHNVLAATVATALLSMGFSMFMGLNATTVQLIVPNALRGRVMSVSVMIFLAMMPLGGLLMSLLVARVGFTPVYLTAAVFYMLSGMAVLLSSGIFGFVPPSAPPEPAHAGPPGEPAAVVAVAD